MKPDTVALTLACIILLNVNPLSGQTSTAPTSGKGSSSSPYEIETLNNYYWLTENSTQWNQYFILTANIDASDTDNWDSGRGPEAIGNTGTKFTGNFDGQGYTIDTLWIDRLAWQGMGLFGRTDGATIKNLKLTNIWVRGHSLVGALVGASENSTISNCFVSGSVHSGDSSVGGLIGKAVTTNINRCASSCSVTGSSNYVAGLTGYNNGVTISNCYATGEVSGAGLYCAGFSGYVQNSNIYYCYSTGNVHYGNITHQGFISFKSGSSVNSCFWNTESSGISSSTGGGTGKTTSEMKILATFTDESTIGLNTAWDFIGSPNDDSGSNDYWDMDNGYPYLSWEDGAEVSLSVELSLFSGTQVKDIVVLDWKTESESENMGFTLERQLVGESFWTLIADFRNTDALAGQGSITSTTTYNYRDQAIKAENTYRYRLSDVDYSGQITRHPVIEVKVISLQQPYDQKIISKTSVFPNPCNPSTNILFTLSEPAQITLQIYDLTGREIATLLSGLLAAGEHQVAWSGQQESKQPLDTGLYLALIQSNKESQAIKLLYIE